MRNDANREELPNLPGADGNTQMRIFDAQQLWMKKELWTSPLNLSLSAVAQLHQAERLIAELRVLEVQSARLVWGADYPEEFCGPLRPRSRRVHARYTRRRP